MNEGVVITVSAFTLYDTLASLQRVAVQVYGSRAHLFGFGGANVADNSFNYLH